MLNQKVALESGLQPGSWARYDGRRRASAAAAPAQAADDADEVTDTLSRLADLRDRGAISPEEYEAKKAELLGRL